MSKIYAAITSALLFAIPLFFLPITTEFYDFNKQALLAAGILVMLTLFTIAYFKSRQLSFIQTPLTIPVLFLALAAIVTLVANSPNKFESLLFPNGAGTTILLAIWFLIIVNTIDLKNVYKYLNAILAGTSILAIISLIQYFKFGFNLVAPKSTWLASQFWSPVGSPLVLVLAILAILPYPLVRAVGYLKINNASGEKRSDVGRATAFAVAATILTVTVAVFTVALFTTAKPTLLPLPFGWAIAAEVMKGMRTAALGVGQLNYIAAFTTGHTAAYNALPIWNIRFGVSSNYFLQIITELGIFGIVTYLLIIFGFVRRFLSYTQSVMSKVVPYNQYFFAISFSIGIIVISQLLLPSNFLQLFLLFTFLGIFARYNATKTFIENSRVLYFMVLLSAIFGIGMSSVTMYNAYAAEVYLKASLDAAQKNKVNDTYNLQQLAIKSNPNVDKYHAVYAQTNLALAVSLAQKKELTESEKSNLTKLVAQAAQSGKNAVAVSPTNVQNWETLGNIYRAMIGAVQNADAWTVQSYQQAARLDPDNPNLMLAIGGVYYNAKNYDTAIQYFTQAIALKRDYPNAYYNLAAAFREKKEWARAADAMKAALDVLPAKSEDRQKAEKELEDIKKNLPAQAEATNSAQIKTPVTVPNEASPQDLISPTPQASPRASAKPTNP